MSDTFLPTIRAFTEALRNEPTPDRIEMAANLIEFLARRAVEDDARLETEILDRADHIERLEPLLNLLQSIAQRLKAPT